MQIKHRITGAVLFEGEAGMTIRQALEKATSAKANLSCAYLSCAYLSCADLSGANLRCANLSGAYLSGADLSGANLSGADLSGAYLSCADLRCSYLSSANLRCANLSGAYLSGAYLSCADLSGANLRCANLSGAYLSGADLSGAKDADYAIAMTRILPDGDIIGWRKCQNNVIVKLRIPESAKRSHAFGRKCRAEYADVLEVIGASEGIGQYDSKVIYRAGERVVPDSWDDNFMDECSHGIHFFITRIEAERD